MQGWVVLSLKRKRGELIKLHTRKTNNPVKNWAEDMNRHFSKEDIQMDGHEKMLNVASHQGNTNQNHTQISPHASQSGPMNKSGDYRYWTGCGEMGTLLDCWWECKLVQPLWKTEWRSLKKLKIDLPYDPAIALVGIYPRDTGVLMHRGTRTPMFIAALSTIAKLWKEPKCPSTDEWIKKWWFIYTMEYYVAMRKNEI